MNTAITRILTAVCAAGLVIAASAQTPSAGTNATPTPPAGDQAPPPYGPPPGGPSDNGGLGNNNASGSQGGTAIVGKPAEPKIIFDNTAAFTPPDVGTNSDEIRLNFRNAPLEMVLNYLSDAAGFIIVLDAPVHGTVNVISAKPMSRDEAVDLLNSVLNKNGLAAIRDGRTLTIVDKNDAKTRDIPVKVSNDPSDIPKNDEIVTQIIPIRFVEADQLVKDLSSFVSPQATIVANEAGNSIVITDTQANIRHLAEIIKAVDSSAESETEIRVFRLKYANPSDVASLLSDLFTSGGNSGNNTQSPIRFGGGPFGGFPFGGFRGLGGGGGGGAASTANSSSDRIKKATTVVAVADARTSSVVVTAAKDLMEQISGMMAQLDVSSTRDQKVYVFHMNNADPQQALSVLQSMFQSGSSTRGSSTSSSSQTSPLMERQANNASSSSSSVSGATSSGGFGGSSGGGRSSGGGLF